MTDMKPCPFCGNDALSIDSSYFRDTLIYCCECDMYFTLDSFKATREDVFEAWNTRAEWKWIPVSEALPEDMDRLLATIVRSDGSKRVRSGHYYKGLFSMDNGDVWNETDKEILAWMPLVEPYGGEE